MADLLWMVQWAGFHLGYANRWTLILAMREHAMARFADDEVRHLLSEATSNDWIAEIGRTATNGPGYVLTRKGERVLARYERKRLAA